MKKTYETPTAEKLSFRYRDQVVAASGDGWANTLLSGCVPEDQRGDYIWNTEVLNICELING